MLEHPAMETHDEPDRPPFRSTMIDVRRMWLTGSEAISEAAVAHLGLHRLVGHHPAFLTGSVRRRPADRFGSIVCALGR